MTPFHIASDHRNEKAMQLLIDHDADKDEPKPYLAELQKAAYRGEEESVKKSLKSGICQNFTTFEATSPLSVASYEGHSNIVKLLLDDNKKNGA